MRPRQFPSTYTFFKVKDYPSFKDVFCVAVFTFDPIFFSYFFHSSRSRSRSHSPFSNRDKKYPRGYQNSREFRGYHRGFRRPYNFRGRGRGQFPRGRYQRGGGGYNNNNNNYYYRPNWKNYRQNPQKQQQKRQQQQRWQFNSSQGQSQNFQKCSESPPQGHSHRSDRSCSPSRHSRHSSSSSHSSSPKCRPASLLVNQNSKDIKEDQVASIEVQKGGGADEEPTEHIELLAGNAREGGKNDGNWHNLTDSRSSPKKNSPLTTSTVTAGQSSQSTSQTSPTKLTNDTSNGATMWQTACGPCSTKKTVHEGLNPMLSSFDIFSSEEYLDGDKKAISIAFRK